MKTTISILVAGLATLSFAAVAQAEDFPATPMNAGPPRMQTMPMMPAAQPMQQPMAAEGMEKPMMKKRMSARQKKMMMMKQKQMAQ